MISTIDRLKDFLGHLPPGHPDRKGVERAIEILLQDPPSVALEDLLRTAERLVESAHLVDVDTAHVSQVAVLELADAFQRLPLATRAGEHGRC